MKSFSIDMQPLLAELNAEQRSAVTHIAGPLLVLAGAGTGKTRVITTRIANLLAHGVEPQNIVAVSFTKKAGGEMKTRLCELLGDAAEAMRVSTFHSLGLAILREQHDEVGLNKGFSVADTKRQRELCEHVVSGIEPQYRPTAQLAECDIRGVVRGLSLAKNAGETPDELKASNCKERQFVGHVLEAYNEQLQRLQLIDLDDMVRLPVQMLEASAAMRRLYQARYKHLLIDEYQDSNLLQNRLIVALLGSERNICVVGDDDQSIYGFRGAKRDLILGFETQFPGATVVKLTANYRCSSEIVGVANAVIKDAPGRHKKNLVAANGSSAPVRFTEAINEADECSFIASDIGSLNSREGMAFRNIAVLVRSERDAEAMRCGLNARGIPHGAKGDGIHLMTLHASKGLEFPVVYVPGVTEEKLPHWNAIRGGTSAIEEERRLLYVGVTRAEKRLTLTSSKHRGKYASSPSRFATGLIEQQLVSHQVLNN